MHTLPHLLVVVPDGRAGSPPKQLDKPTLARTGPLRVPLAIVNDELYAALARELTPHCLCFLACRIMAELASTVLPHEPVVLSASYDVDRLAHAQPPQTPRPYQARRAACPPFPFAGMMDVGVHSAKLS